MKANMNNITKTHSYYWADAKCSVATGVTLFIAAGLHGIWAYFSTGGILIMLTTLSGTYAFCGTLFFVDAAAAKGRHFQQMRSAVKNILPQSKFLQDEHL